MGVMIVVWWGCKLNNFIISFMIQTKMKVNPRGPEFQSRKDVQELVNLSKNLFDVFPTFQLEASRLFKIKQFQQLIEEIILFNDELVKWKKNQHEIRNIIVTYHLYENLFSRLKFISNFCKSPEQSQGTLNKVIEWFSIEKPKLRCQVKQKSAFLKSGVLDPNDQIIADKLMQSNIIKRQLQAYQLMSRTAHPGFFPPKQELREYKRKQFLPFSGSQHTQNPITQKKSSSASTLSKNRLSKFRMSMGTMATTSTTSFKALDSLKNTVSEFKIESIPEQNKQDTKKQVQENFMNAYAKKQEEKIIDQKLEDAEREDLVQKDQILQGNLVSQMADEDIPDEDDENIFQDQDIKQNKKIYAHDYDQEEIQYTKELVKENQQSTLRRIMKINEDKIRSKMEDLDIRRNMKNWGKVKGRNTQMEMRKLQGLLHCNRFNDIAYQNKSAGLHQNSQIENQKIMNETTGFQQTPIKNQPVVFPMFYRSKSSYPGAIESDIEKLKIKRMLKTYGKYINHHLQPEVPEQDTENGQKSQIRKSTEAIRSMSLTSLAAIPKKKQFSNILRNNNAENYNEEVHEEIIRIKTSLSKKGASIQKGTIYRALSTLETQEVEGGIGFYTAGRDLPSNPFFPKNIGKKKKKK